MPVRARRGGLSHRQSARDAVLRRPRRWGQEPKTGDRLAASGRSHRWGQELLQYVIILLQLAIASREKATNYNRDSAAATWIPLTHTAPAFSQPDRLKR